jgi:hypothetical protein
MLQPLDTLVVLATRKLHRYVDAGSVATVVDVERRGTRTGKVAVRHVPLHALEPPIAL